MSSPLDECFQKALNRWKSTEPEHTEEVRTALTRLYGQLGLPAPSVVWCDSPWQLAVAPFLTSLVCFQPNEIQRSRLGRAFDYDGLRRFLTSKLEADLTNGLWPRALESVMSQVRPDIGSVNDDKVNEQNHSEVSPTILERAAARLSSSDVFDKWDDTNPVDTYGNAQLANAFKTILQKQELPITSSAVFAAIQQRRASMNARFQDYIPALLDLRWLHATKKTPQARGLEGPCHMRVAFEQNFREDTGLSIKEIDGSEAPWIGIQDLLAIQFQKQMGDAFCSGISSLLVSGTEAGAFECLHDVFQDFHRRSTKHGQSRRPSFPVILPKSFGHNNFAVVRGLSQSEILPIAEAIRRTRLVWSSWSLDLLRITMQLEDPDSKDRAELKAELLDCQRVLNGSFMYVLSDKFAFACKKPVALRFDEMGQFHSYSAPAIEFADGYKMYFWQNIRVREELVTKPEILTVKYIADEPNAEVRRVLIDKYGPTRYLADSRATEIVVDAVGVLYHIPAPGETMALVKVVNRTPKDAAICSWRRGQFNYCKSSELSWKYLSTIRPLSGSPEGAGTVP